MQVTSGAYCIAVAHLINHSKDAQGAIAAATTWLQNGLDASLQQVRGVVGRLLQADCLNRSPTPSVQHS
jgi:hypothetical protein